MAMLGSIATQRAREQLKSAPLGHKFKAKSARTPHVLLRYNVFTMQLTGGLASHLRSASRGLIYALVFLIPLTVLPYTIDPLEINKQTLLVLLTLCATLLWLASCSWKKKEVQAWTHESDSASVCRGFCCSSSYFYCAVFSWIGAHRQEYTSVATAVALGLLIYSIGNTFVDRKVINSCTLSWSSQQH